MPGSLGPAPHRVKAAAKPSPVLSALLGKTTLLRSPSSTVETLTTHRALKAEGLTRIGVTLPEMEKMLFHAWRGWTSGWGLGTIRA